MSGRAMIVAINRSRALIRSGKAKEALTILNDLRDQYPDNARVLLEMAFLHDNFGREATAIPLYEKSLRLGTLSKHQRRDALICLGSSYGTVGNPRRAKSRLRAAVAENPRDCVAELFLALVLIDMNDYQRAVTVLAEALLRETRSKLKGYAPVLERKYRALKRERAKTSTRSPKF